MNIVKVSRKPNGRDGRVSTQVGIPLTILRDLPSDLNHMTVETVVEPSGRIAVVYRPLELGGK